MKVGLRAGGEVSARGARGGEPANGMVALFTGTMIWTDYVAVKNFLERQWMIYRD